MEQKIYRFFMKHGIQDKNVKYIIREDAQTLVFLFDGKVITTYIPAKTLVEALGQDQFLNVNKGIFLNTRYITNIDKNTYVTVDNHRFVGRHRPTSEQKAFKQQWKQKISSLDFSNQMLPNLSVFDHCPLGFCIIEIVFNEHGTGVDFLFRYCNKMMEKIENLTIEQMVDHSFFDLFPNDGLKWVASYADVAINGVQKVIHEYSPKLSKYLSVYCFQIKERFCGCIVLDSAQTVQDILSHIDITSSPQFSFLSSLIQK